MAFPPGILKLSLSLTSETRSKSLSPTGSVSPLRTAAKSRLSVHVRYIIYISAIRAHGRSGLDMHAQTYALPIWVCGSLLCSVQHMMRAGTGARTVTTFSHNQHILIVITDAAGQCIGVEMELPYTLWDNFRHISHDNEFHWGGFRKWRDYVIYLTPQRGAGGDYRGKSVIHLPFPAIDQGK